MKKIVIILFLLLLPYTIFAAEFVQQPLFLSKSPVTEGQRIRVYAIVSNDASAMFNGTVLIAEDGITLGSPSASLAVGATQTVSVVWTPTKGTHVITAQLTANDGTVVQQVSQTFSILALPVPVVALATSQATYTNQNPSGYESSASIVQAINNVSPTVSKDTQPIFSVIDNTRSNIVKALNVQVTNADKAISNKTKTSILIPNKNNSKTVSLTTPINILLQILWTCYLYLLIFLRFLISNPLFFYPILVILFLYALCKILF